MNTIIKTLKIIGLPILATMGVIYVLVVLVIFPFSIFKFLKEIK